MKNIFGLLLLLSVLMTQCASAQKEPQDTFTLTATDSGHYLMDVNIGGEVQAKALLESGIHVMIIDMDFATQNSEAVNVSFHPDNKNDRINLGGDLYRISHKGRGRVMIGNNTAYEGEVYLLPGLAANHYTGMTMAIPIHKLVNTTDGSHVVRLDMPAGQLDMLGHSEADSITNGWSTSDINYDSYMDMPAVRTRFTVGNRAAIDGNFNIDLGNPMVLFLFAQSKNVQHDIYNNDNINVMDAADNNGNVIAQAFIADECNLCGRTFHDATIAITRNVPRFTTDGCIGLRFFNTCPAVFDFDHSVMYTRPQ